MKRYLSRENFLNVRKFMILMFLIALWSCEKNENDKKIPVLQNCDIDYLNFSLDFRLRETELIFLPTDTLKPILTYQYLKGKVVKIIGGFTLVPTGFNFNRKRFSTDVYDSLVYSGDSVKVYTKSNQYSSVEQAIYVYNRNNTIERLICNRWWREAVFTCNENNIPESYKIGSVIGKLFFENNNLYKVEETLTDSLNIIWRKREVFFQEYDNNPNPFKNKFHLLGSFYRAFSDNNYTSLNVRDYYYNGDSLVMGSNYIY